MLFRDRGYSSMNQYAMRELSFSKSRTDNYVRLAKRLGKLPAVRSAVASGKLGYTKAREVVAVATPETEDQWLKAAVEGSGRANNSYAVVDMYEDRMEVIGYRKAVSKKMGRNGDRSS